MRTRGTRFAASCRCSVAADDPPPLAEGTDGCGAGWSSPPKGRPLKTTNATKRRTAPNATAVRLTRCPQRFASPTVTASCSAASFCGLGRRGGAEGLTARLGGRAALSTGRARRTTSPPGPRARTASCSAATFCGRGRRGGAEGSTSTVSGSSRAVLSASRSSRAVSSTGRARRTTSPPGPRARPLRAVQHRSAVAAAAAESKAQRPPSPDLAAQCCQHPDLAARCRQPVERGEPRHRRARAPSASCSAASFRCPGRRG